ncbi:hypothetical protein, partial [Phaeobacter sp. CECT 5382]|uniref:hypothetical protein n=1 Tax=Phaeobacter sp. CECT 5382 TaxID=1712645 RepID=UPI001E6379B5
LPCWIHEMNPSPDLCNKAVRHRKPNMVAPILVKANIRLLLGDIVNCCWPCAGRSLSRVLCCDRRENILSAGVDFGHGIHPILISMIGKSVRTREKNNRGLIAEFRVTSG